MDNTGDVVIETSNNGTDTVKSYVSHTLSANVENLTLIGHQYTFENYGETEPIYGIGNSLDNIITANPGSNHLYGLDGNDTFNSYIGFLQGRNSTYRDVESHTMEGGKGNDKYYVAGANSVNSSGTFSGDRTIELPDEGIDHVFTQWDHVLEDHVENLTISDTVAASRIGTGNSLDNYIYGGDGHNILDGKSGADHLYGGQGNDILDGNSGADHLYGGQGNDIYYVDNTADVIVEDANNGYDKIYSSATYTYIENVEELILIGSADINVTGDDLG